MLSPVLSSNNGLVPYSHHSLLSIYHEFKMSTKCCQCSCPQRSKLVI